MKCFFVGAAVAVTVTVAAAHASAQETSPPFGGADDVAYAAQLWTELAAARLVGRGAIETRPYEGAEPHGAILATLQTSLVVAGHEGPAIVKRNYLGESVSVQSVSDNPDLNLDAVTVMFRRESGYDPETRNWFWAKYQADGTLATNPQGVPLAGRISKNPDDGCIACHRFAPGLDYVFLNDRFAVPEAIAAVAEAPGTAVFTRLTPLEIQPGADDLEPGLSVVYHFNIFNFAKEIVEFARTDPGVVGEPLRTLDYNVGSGTVLNSGQRDGVGAVINGLINFPTAGVYTMAMQSNDGVELTIGGQIVIDDPTVHADRFSAPVQIDISEPGWYPLNLLYFEKRNTSTLELYWTPPDSEEGLTFVPAEAFAHLR